MVLIVSTLAGAGFAVSATDNYADAKMLLGTHRPLVLVTEIRLGPYNGIQLALRAVSIVPRVSVVVASEFSDPVLERDTERTGATFAVKPLTGEELLAAVYRTALRQPGAQGGLEPVRRPFERRQAERRQIVTDPEVERRLSPRRRDIAGLVRSMALG
jgi:DNA-binding NtrC family response regulator